MNRPSPVQTGKIFLPLRFINLDFTLMALLVIAQSVPFFSDKVIPIHDSMLQFSLFHYFYSFFFFHLEIPGWMHYGVYGIPSLIEQLVSIQPSGYLVALIGAVFKIKSALLLFKVAVVIDQLILLTGVYLLAKRLFASRTATFIVCIGSACSTAWLVQIGFGLRAYYMVPLAVYLLFRYFDSLNPKWIWMTGILTILSFLGSYAYLAPVYLLIFSMVFGGMLIRHKNALTLLLTPSLPNATTFLCFVLVVLSFMFYISHMFDYLTVFHDPDAAQQGLTLKSKWFSLANFLTHGSQTIKSFKLPEMISGMRIHTTPAPVYTGLLPIFFFCWACFKVRRPSFLIFLCITLLLTGLSSGGLIATILFLFPGMAFYHHLGHLCTVTKPFLLLCAGYGINDFLARLQSGRWSSIAETLNNRKIFLTLVLGGVFLIDSVTSYHFHNVTTRQSLRPDIIAAVVFSFRVLMYGFCFRYAIHCLLQTGHLQQKQTKKIQSIIILCFTIDMLSFQAVSFIQAPRTGMEDGSIHFDAYLPVFQKKRTSTMETGRQQSLSAILNQKMEYRNEHYASAYYGLLQYDPCSPAKEVRIPFMPIGLTHLIRTRGAQPSGFGEHGLQPAFDATLGGAMGCEAPKLQLVPHGILADSLEQESDLLATSADLQNFVILRAESQHKELLSEHAFEIFNKARLSVGPEGGKEISYITRAVSSRDLQIRLSDDKKNNFWETTSPFPHWISYDFGYKRQIPEYWMRAGKEGMDSNSRMPGAWQMEGSNDGKIWVTLDQRDQENHWENDEIRRFEIHSPDAYRLYRLKITNNATNTSILRLGEWGMSFPEERIAPKGDYHSAVDSSLSLKDFSSETGTGFWETITPFPHWVRFTYGRPIQADSYNLSVGEYGADSTQRMPREWEFQGSRDGQSWVTLDHRTDETNWKNGEMRTYHCSNSLDFAYYRLVILSGIDERILRLSHFSINQRSPISIKHFSANRLELSVTTSQPQWLVYADSFHPGWTARVNGSSVPIFEANLAFKAVRLEKGTHQVVFSFNQGLLSKLRTVFAFEGIALTLACLGLFVRLLFSSTLEDNRLNREQ